MQVLEFTISSNACRLLCYGRVQDYDHIVLIFQDGSNFGVRWEQGS